MFRILFFILKIFFIVYRVFNSFRNRINPLYSFEVFKKASGICLEGLDFPILSTLETGRMSSQNTGLGVACENSNAALLTPGLSPCGCHRSGQLPREVAVGTGADHAALSSSCAFWAGQSSASHLLISLILSEALPPCHFLCASLFKFWLFFFN